MGLFDFVKPRDINEGVKTCAEMAGAMLLDVRNKHEYAAGHIPGSVNLPLPMISEAGRRIPDKAARCLSAALPEPEAAGQSVRSRQWGTRTFTISEVFAHGMGEIER